LQKARLSWTVPSTPLGSCGPLGARLRQARARQDIATVIFSSGSTAEPKAHRAQPSQHRPMRNNDDPGPVDLQPRRPSVRRVLPFFHSFGYTVTLWCRLQAGAIRDLSFPNPRPAREIGELCPQACCTIFLTTPTFLRSVSNAVSRRFRQLAHPMCGGRRCRVSVLRISEEVRAVLPLGKSYGARSLSPACSAPTCRSKEIDGFRQWQQVRAPLGQRHSFRRPLLAKRDNRPVI